MRRFRVLIIFCLSAILLGAGILSLADDTCIFDGRTLTRSTTFVSPVLSTSQGVATGFVYLSLFLPTAERFWEGNVVKLGLATDETIIDSYGNPAVDANGAILETAVPFWQTKDWADLTKFNGIPNTRRNIYTYLGASSDLTLISNEFATSNPALTSAVLGAPSAPPEQIINFVRGADAFDADTDGDSTENRPVMTGDVLHSEPFFFEYRFPDGTSKTMVYFGANDGMLHAVLDMEDPDLTIDGDEIIHGTEAWAFIPSDQLHRLKEMVEGSGHQYYVDGSPKLYFKDVNGNGIIETNVDSDGDGDVDDDDKDRVILVCGERKGGTSYFAIDVTTPESPVFMWRLSNTNDAVSGRVGLDNVTGSFEQEETLVFAGGASARVKSVVLADLLNYDQRTGSIHAGELVTGQISGATGMVSFFTHDAPPDAGPDVIIPELGETWSEPKFAVVKTSDEETDKGTVVLFVGGGFSPDNTMGKAILVLAVETGNTLKIFKNGVNGISGMEFSIPSTVALVDGAGNGFIDKVYVGDLGGKMWRLGRFTDAEGSVLFPQGDENINRWTGHVLFQANQPSTPTPPRKFFYPPSVTLERGYDLLLTGTGDREDPCAVVSQDRIYAIMDRHELEESGEPSGFPPKTFNESDLVNVTDPSGPTPNLDRETNDVDENGKLDRGWDIRLEAGEKVLSKGVVLNRVYFVNSYTPDISGGVSKLYGLDYKTGAPRLPPTVVGEDGPTRSRVIGGGMTAGPVPVLMEQGLGLLVAPGEGAAEGEEGAGLLAITPPFPPINFFYLWWMSL